MGIKKTCVIPDNSCVIIGIVVTFSPDMQALRRLLVALQPQVSKVVVVDNGTIEDVTAAQPLGYGDDCCQFIKLGNNRGIAAAQNVGIERSKQLNADYVILFDQDSEPALDMVENLVAVVQEQVAAGIKVAAVGPRYLDNRQNNPPPFIKVRGFKVERQPCPYVDTVAEVDYLIASGCLFPMAALNLVGGMREELFIDYVDIEWGLRAKHLGLQSFGVCAATMRHDLGDEPLVFMGRKFPARCPLRHYYMFRNAIWMYRQYWVPMQWKMYDGWRLILKYGFYTLFAKPRHKHWRMMTLGLWHGMVGETGKLKEGAS